MDTRTDHRSRAAGLTRRGFLGAGAAGLTALSAGRVLGANERIGVGVIGFGLIGRIHTRNLKDMPGAAVTAVCDVYQPRLEAAATLAGGGVAKHRDFRKVLDSRDVDGVWVTTPDHWHALLTMLACAAGKDVYVEKPMTLFVREGRWMVDVARRHKRIIQVGTQNRSGPTFQRARDFLRDGKLGRIVSVEENYSRNLMPGFGNPPDQDPPAGLDWDLWLGPAPKRAYNPNRAIYHFRWIWDYAGGQMTNLGQHSLDVVHWFTGVTAPRSVYSTGGRFFLKDNMETPDTQDTLIEYPGFTAVLKYREATGSREGLGMGGVVFSGTLGSMPVGRTGFEVFPDTQVDPINTMAAILGGHPVGGPQPIPEEKGRLRTEKLKDASGNGNRDFVEHERNFLDCMRSRKDPLVDVETGHRVATACHLANISLRTGRKITWDAEREEIVGDPAAGEMLRRPYREPWASELRALGVSS
jgi:predicted dehydrogenase